jgi:hypothetical protein
MNNNRTHKGMFMFPLARSVGWLGLLAIAFGLLCPPLIRESAGQRNATQRTRKKDQKTAPEVLKNDKGVVNPAALPPKGSVKVRVTVGKIERERGYLSRYPLWICVGNKRQQVTKEGTYIFNDLKPGTSTAYFQAAACWLLTPFGGFYPEKVTIRANKTTTLHWQVVAGFLGCG